MDFKIEKKRLPCTLWKEYIDQLLPYLQDENIKHVIVLIQFGRAKECAQLIGKSAGDLKAVNNDDALTICKDNEDAMADKDALFKVQIKSAIKGRSFDTYNVLKMAVDKGVAAREKD
ncbi:hypothetical protein OROHE_012969 [Orobanche hederae]